MNRFQTSFARMNKRSFFKESFRVIKPPVNGMLYTAIAIEELAESTRQAFGGDLKNATLTVRVSQDTMEAAGLQKGVVIEARGEQVRLMDKGVNGAEGITFHCGPVSTTVNL